MSSLLHASSVALLLACGSSESSVPANDGGAAGDSPLPGDGRTLRVLVARYEGPRRGTTATAVNGAQVLFDQGGKQRVLTTDASGRVDVSGIQWTAGAISLTAYAEGDLMYSLIDVTPERLSAVHATHGAKDVDVVLPLYSSDALARAAGRSYASLSLTGDPRQELKDVVSLGATIPSLTLSNAGTGGEQQLPVGKGTDVAIVMAVWQPFTDTATLRGFWRIPVGPVTAPMTVTMSKLAEHALSATPMTTKITLPVVLDPLKGDRVDVFLSTRESAGTVPLSVSTSRTTAALTYTVEIMRAALDGAQLMTRYSVAHKSALYEEWRAGAPVDALTIDPLSIGESGDMRLGVAAAAPTTPSGTSLRIWIASNLPRAPTWIVDVASDAPTTLTLPKLPQPFFRAYSNTAAVKPAATFVVRKLSSYDAALDDYLMSTRRFTTPVVTE